MKKSTTFILMFLTAIVTASLVLIFGRSIPLQLQDQVMLSKNEYDRMIANEKRFSKLLSLEKQIKSNFYKGTEGVDFETGMIRGLFSSLNDPYSVYFTKEEFEEFNRESKGTFIGVGIHITETEEGLIKIVSPIKGTPGYEAGLKSGDLIYRIDDTEVNGINLKEAVNLMLGEAGTKVTLHIRRGTETLSFDITRAKVIVPSVEAEMKSGGTGYLRINGFDDEKTLQEFKRGLDELKAQGMTSMVLDLRNNPGGSLHQVIEIADMILPKAKILTTVYPNGKKDEYDSDENNQLSIPYVVLINKGSASASEILAGAIKDNGTAKVIGEKSFGKGLVQSIRALNDGTGFKLTTAYYLTPAGNNIHEVGIIPDIDMEAIAKKGYSIEDNAEFGSAQDGVLNFAMDLLQGKN